MVDTRDGPVVQTPVRVRAVEVPVEGAGVPSCGLVGVHGCDEVPFPAEHVYLLGLGGVGLEHTVHAQCLEDAGGVGEDLDSCSDLFLVLVRAF